MKELKAKILSNLDFLPNKVNFNKADDEVVYLEAVYFDEFTQYNYTLRVELIVLKIIDTDGQIKIQTFIIESIYFYYNNGLEPKFKFSNKELTDYIDF